MLVVSSKKDIHKFIFQYFCISLSVQNNESKAKFHWLLPFKAVKLTHDFKIVGLLSRFSPFLSFLYWLLLKRKNYVPGISMDMAISNSKSIFVYSGTSMSQQQTSNQQNSQKYLLNCMSKCNHTNKIHKVPKLNQIPNIYPTPISQRSPTSTSSSNIRRHNKRIMNWMLLSL